MTLDQQINGILQSIYDSGATQQDMAKTMHVSQQYIQRLLSGQRNVSGLTVKVLMKMFPRATLNIKGDAVIADNSGTNHGVVGVNNGTVNGAASPVASAEDFRDKAIKVLMDLEIPPDSLVKVLKTLKDLEI